MLKKKENAPMERSLSEYRLNKVDDCCRCKGKNE